MSTRKLKFIGLLTVLSCFFVVDAFARYYGSTTCSHVKKGRSIEFGDQLGEEGSSPFDGIRIIKGKERSTYEFAEGSGVDFITEKGKVKRFKNFKGRTFPLTVLATKKTKDESQTTKCTIMDDRTYEVKIKYEPFADKAETLTFTCNEYGENSTAGGPGCEE